MSMCMCICTCMCLWHVHVHGERRMIARACVATGAGVCGYVQCLSYNYTAVYYYVRIHNVRVRTAATG